MTSDNAGTAKSSPGRGLRIALIASLALNVLIIGAVGSALLFSRHGGLEWKHHGHKFGLLGFAQTLPAERQQVILEAIESGRAAMKPVRKAEREAREAAREVLLEEPFGEEKLKAALDRVVEAGTNKRTAWMALFAETAAKLTAEERRELYKWIKRHRSHRRRRRRE